MIQILHESGINLKTKCKEINYLQIKVSLLEKENEMMKIDNQSLRDKLQFYENKDTNK